MIYWWLTIGLATTVATIFMASRYDEEPTTLADIFAMIMLSVFGPIFTMMFAIIFMKEVVTKIIIFNGKKDK